MPTKKLRVGFVLDDGLDRLDGVQQYVVTLGRWLVTQGHEVHYLVGETKSQEFKNIHEFSKNIKVKFNGNQLSSPLPASNKKIKAFLDREKFDILHIQVPYSPFMAAKVVKLASRSTKIVGTFHVLPYGRLQKTAVYLLGFLLKRNLKRFDAMFAVSTPAASFCKNAFKARPEVVPNLVEIAKLKPIKKSPVQKNIKIIFFGRLVIRKGCKNFVEAINKIKKNMLVSSAFEVEIGGSGPEEKLIKRKIKECGLEKTIKFRGYIDEKNKPAFLQSADVAVFPSLGGESFGIVLVEAIAAGAGVVMAGNNPGYKTVLDKTPEALFDPNNIDEFAGLLAELINNPKKREKINNKQQRIIEQFESGTVGRKIEAKYYELLGSLAK